MAAIKNSEILEVLLADRRADVHATTSKDYTLWHTAILNNNSDSLRVLVKNDSLKDSMDSKDIQNGTPMQWAKKLDFKEGVKIRRRARQDLEAEGRMPMQSSEKLKCKKGWRH